MVALLEAITDGHERLIAERDPQEIFTGDVTYTTDSGWQLSVSADMNSYGGFNHIDAPDGRTLPSDLLDNMDRDIDAVFDRNKMLEWEGFGLGGYMRFRCRVCGAQWRYEDNPSCSNASAICLGRQSPRLPSRLKIKANSIGK